MSVILCDDHTMFLHAFAAALSGRGHHVQAVTDDADTLLLLVQEQRPDAVVLDVSLQGRSGLDVARDLRRVAPDVAILLLTACTGREVRDAYEAGVADGLVSKTCDIRVIEVAIGRVVAGHRVLAGWVSAPAPVARQTPLEPLTGREKQVLGMIVGGASTMEISAGLGISTNTVRTHVQNLHRKLGVHHRGKAVRRALELGLVGAA